MNNDDFNIPPSWQRGTLGEVCSLKRESCDPELTKLEVYVGLEHLDSGAFRFIRHGSPRDVVSGKSCFSKGDILYGKLRPYLDKAALANCEGICSTDILVFKPKPDACAHFITALVHTRDFVKFAEQTTAGVHHPRTSWASLQNFPALIPPTEEQKKIAAVLWKLQQAIEVEAGLARCARDLKKSAMRQLFAVGLRSDSLKITQFGEVPESWEIMPLSSCAYVQTGATKGREIPDADALEVPYLRVANVQDGHLDLTEMKTIRIRKSELDGLLLRRDDVVLTEGGDFDKLGRGFIWEGQIEQCVHQNHIFAVRVNREKLLPRYFAYLAQSPYGRAYFLSVAHKTTNLACINTTKLRAFPVLIPQLDEQEEIAEILGTLDRKIAVHDAKQRAWQDLFKTMLHKLMTAQIRVSDLDIDTRELEA